MNNNLLIINSLFKTFILFKLKNKNNIDDLQKNRVKYTFVSYI